MRDRTTEGPRPRVTPTILVGAVRLLRSRGFEPNARRVRAVAGLAGSFVSDGLGTYEALAAVGAYIPAGRPLPRWLR
jgi:hypothetical protein